MALIDYYPSIKEAALNIAYENGVVNRTTTETEVLENLDEIIDSHNNEDLNTIDRWLCGLDEVDFENLTTGDVDSAEFIMEGCPMDAGDNFNLSVIITDIFDKIIEG